MPTIIPACLIDLIGIEPCEGQSTYLRLLTELEGLSISSIAATADPDKWTSARKEIEGLVPLGFEATINRLKRKMSAQGFIMKSVIDTGEFCVFGTAQQTGLTAGDQGLYIQKNLLLQPSSQPIRVKWLKLKSPNLTTNIPVRITDEVGNTLWSTTVATLPANTEFEVTVNQDFYEDRIKIVNDGTDMQAYYAPCNTGGGGCAGCDDPPYSSPINFLRSAFYVNAIEGGAVGGFKSPGIRAAIELPCNINLFCKYGPELANAAKYDTGVAILKNWKASTRLNVFTLKKEWVAETMPEWSAEADALVEDALPYIMADMQRCFPRCFDCQQPVGTMPALP
jgi:hypothetical protein